MYTIVGYQLYAHIATSPHCTVYRAYSERDQRSVILKLLAAPDPMPADRARLQHEYSILRTLDSPGVVRCYRLDQVDGRPMLVLEDFGGTALDQLGLAGTLDPDAFLNIAIAIAGCISQVHAAEVIHKDITPGNIVYNPGTGQIKLIDFSLATRLRREEVTFQSPTTLEGTLAYISPEQSGRMNRAVDYRTDFYSLGVTLYELLTGQRPFRSDDPLELVHAHLARQPRSPHEDHPRIPPALSAIIMKLLAKGAEERYQSAQGLIADLTFCREHLGSTEHLATLTPGRSDRAVRFQIPQNLYGRTGEVTRLIAAFDRIAAGSRELVLVAGPPGVGKTMLVREIHRPVTARRGRFVGGKFDQYRRTIPYGAWVQAFTSLVGQLLTESEEQLAGWRVALHAALGDNVRVITDLIPILVLVTGAQPLARHLEGKEAQSRLEFVLRSFVRVFARPEHPLVIFLDDLHWADAASLSLLHLLLSEKDTGSLLLIGAYRDTEVGPAHPLLLTVADIRQAGATATALTLKPLNRADANQMIADTLACPPAQVQPFTELLYQKTQGNPFFTTQLLQALHDEHLMTFNTLAGQWESDLAQVRAFTLTDDAVSFLTQQIKKLPAATQHLLTLAACLGNHFDLATLALAAERPDVALSADFWPALQLGLVIPTHERYQFHTTPTASVSPQPEMESTGPTYRFLHDQVQQAAASLATEGERQAIHLQIGRRLLERTPDAPPAQLFVIMQHLNQGIPLVTAQAERDTLARLNLRAGQEARDVAAFAVARDFFTAGLELMGTDRWQRDYALTLSLTEAAAEAAYLCGDFAEMERLSASVLAEAHAPLDTVKVYETRIQGLVSQSRFLEGVQLGLHALSQLGVTIPEQPGEADVGAALQATQAVVPAQGIAALVDLPLMTDPTQLAIIRLCGTIISPALTCSPVLYMILTFMQVSLSIQYGNTPIATYSYAAYAQLLCSMLGDIETGYQFGQLALQLLHRMNVKELTCKVQATIQGFVNHWKKPIRDTLLPLRAAHISGLETGDYQFSSYTAVMYVVFMSTFGIEKNLADVYAEAIALSETILRTRHMAAYQYMQLGIQEMHDQIVGRASLEYLQGEHYNEQVMLPRHLAANDRLALFLLYSGKLKYNYLFGAYEQAVVNATQTTPYLDGAIGSAYIPLFVVYDSLARLAAYRAGYGDADEVQRMVADNQAQVAGWARHAPANWQHAWDLVEAERQRSFDHTWETLAAYDRAIAGATTHGFLREAALAHERVAEFYLERGQELPAQAHMQAAHAGYARWGATAKVTQIEQRYARWFAPAVGTTDAHQRIPTHATTSITSAVQLDLSSVIKASHAIAGEIDLPRLLDRMMRIVLENAGAQRGMLLIERGGSWRVTAYGLVEASGVTILLETGLPDLVAVPQSLINYVARTRDSVVLNNAASAGAFVDDPVIQQGQTKSVLCTPLLNQSQVSGILYLENNLTSGAFTPGRVELLTLLSTQMAMSLDNAHVYARLEAKVAERTRELAQAKEVAEHANDLKTKFLTNMSHELRTPLNAILNFTRFLSKERYGTLTVRQQELQQRVLANANHLLGLINDLLDLSKIEAGRMDLQYEEVDLLPLLHGVMSTAVGLTRDKGLQLELIAPEALAPVWIDKTRIRQVLLNLLSNAAKFTKQGGITVRVTSDTHVVQIDVQDTGIGIAPEHQALIFAEFRQIQDELQSEQQGTGLGLPIAQQLVELHGGHLWLESTLGVGSTFSFTLRHARVL